uniref:Diacylglycerol kinase accessory domain-containing protein n=1 Tax=Meloidogyne javanica TaxID=6303 RepID=A0A915MM72_MELJA
MGNVSITSFEEDSTNNNFKIQNSIEQSSTTITINNNILEQNEKQNFQRIRYRGFGGMTILATRKKSGITSNSNCGAAKRAMRKRILAAKSALRRLSNTSSSSNVPTSSSDLSTSTKGGHTQREVSDMGLVQIELGTRRKIYGNSKKSLEIELWHHQTNPVKFVEEKREFKLKNILKANCENEEEEDEFCGGKSSFTSSEEKKENIKKQFYPQKKISTATLLGKKRKKSSSVVFCKRGNRSNSLSALSGDLLPIEDGVNKTALELNCLHCALLAEYRTNGLRAEIECAVKRLAARLTFSGSPARARRMFADHHHHQQQQREKKALEENERQMEMLRRQMGTPDIVVSSCNSEGTPESADEDNGGLNQCSSPPRSNSVDLSQLRRDIELWSVSSLSSAEAGSSTGERTAGISTPGGDSIRTVRSRSFDPSGSPDCVLRRPSRIEHLSEIFRKALAKSPVEVIAINCSWCKRSYHNKRSCFSLARFDDRCDKGILRELILPPNWLLRLSNQRRNNRLNEQQTSNNIVAISLKRNRKKYRPFIVKFLEQTTNNVGPIPLIGGTRDEASNSQQPPIQPLLAFVNPKSGGNKGAKALNTLCWLLNPRQENKEQLNNECQTTLPLSVMNNYFSIGADAHVALQFHHSRSANPQMLNSRLKNRLAYGGLGTIDLFKRAWKDLSEYITVECDGVDITPKIREFKFHCILFHNISFYAGGTVPWGQGGDGVQESCGEVFSRPSPCDGKIEVLGFTTATL